MRGRTLRIGAAVLLCGAVALSGWAWHHLQQRHAPPFSISEGSVVARRIYSMQGMKTLEEAPQLQGFEVVGNPVPVSPALAANLRRVLNMPTTYTFHDTQCFAPGMAFSIGEGSNRVDVLVCLLCNRAVFYRGGAEAGRCLSDEGDQQFASFYKELFKSDPPTYERPKE